MLVSLAYVRDVSWVRALLEQNNLFRNALEVIGSKFRFSCATVGRLYSCNGASSHPLLKKRNVGGTSPASGSDSWFPGHTAMPLPSSLLSLGALVAGHQVSAFASSGR